MSVSELRRGNPSGQIRSCRRVTLTELTWLVGDGDEGSPFREITAYFDDKGRCVAWRDPEYTSLAKAAGVFDSDRFINVRRTE